MKAKTLFLLLFSLFLYEKEPEPVKKKYLELEPVKKGPAPQHCMQHRIADVQNSIADMQHRIADVQADVQNSIADMQHRIADVQYRIADMQHSIADMQPVLRSRYFLVGAGAGVKI